MAASIVSANAGKAMLKKYSETQFISANKDLQRMMRELESGGVVLNKEIEELIKTNRWKAFDKYILDNVGKIKFFEILQQLFLLHYFVDDKISRRQFQTALGIQQVRWMVDPENSKDISTMIKNAEGNPVVQTKEYEVVSADLFIWEDIMPEIRSNITAKLYSFIQDRLYEPKPDESLNFHYLGSIWYKVKTKPEEIRAWRGWGPEFDYYTIPETFNFSRIACIYAPTLLFGSLSEPSLLKYIMGNKLRPYVMHLPGALSNLFEIHGNGGMIVANWRHDFTHSRGNPSCATGFPFLMEHCYEIFKEYRADEPLVKQINNEDSPLNKCLRDKTPKKLFWAVRGGPGGLGTKGALGVGLATILNDMGVLWSVDERVPIVGGTRRKRFRNKRQSRRRNLK